MVLLAQTVESTHLHGLPPPYRGKVRDIYDLGSELLLVATDRISCFDVVLPTCIPQKGKMLTQMSQFWFQMTKDIIPNHLSSRTINDVVPHEADRQLLEKRSLVVNKAKPLPIEAIVRGYLSGSGWKEYQQSKTVCGLPLPPGLEESSLLPQTLFTPSTKARQGLHDENIPFEKMEAIIGKDLAHRVRQVSIELYRTCAEYALKRGIIIADTKFEFGIFQDELILIDELFTPDSSRFWPKDTYQPGKPQPSFDKQFVRDYLESIHWNKQPPAPSLPSSIVEKTHSKYAEALRRLVNP